MRLFCELLEPVAAETPYGGRVVSYEPLGAVWLRLDRQGLRQRSDDGAVSVSDTARAETRTDPRLIEGRVIRFGGDDWIITAVQGDPDRPGRVTLNIERTR